MEAKTRRIGPEPILKSVIEHYKKEKALPTRRDIATCVPCSVSTAQYYINKLIETGDFTRTSNIPYYRLNDRHMIHIFNSWKVGENDKRERTTQ